MSGTTELKQLILMIDTHRQNIGNSQYSFPMDSENRYILQRFSATIPRMRPEAFVRIKALFWQALPWIDRPEQVAEITSDYVWSLVYPLHFNTECHEQTYKEMVKELETAFLAELQQVANINHQTYSLIEGQGRFYFAQESEQLAMLY